MEKLLPITVTHQVQDGCVSASAKSFIPFAGIDFTKDFFPHLKPFCLDPGNFANIHMLGIPIAATQLRLNVHIHTKNPLINDVITDNAPPVPR